MHRWGSRWTCLLLPLGALYVLLGVTQGTCRTGSEPQGWAPDPGGPGSLGAHCCMGGVVEAGRWESGLRNPPSHGAGHKGPQPTLLPLWSCTELLASLCSHFNKYYLAPCQGWGKGLWRGTVPVGSHSCGGVTRPWDAHKAQPQVELPGPLLP